MYLSYNYVQVSLLQASRSAIKNIKWKLLLANRVFKPGADPGREYPVPLLTKATWMASGQATQPPVANPKTFSCGGLWHFIGYFFSYVANAFSGRRTPRLQQPQQSCSQVSALIRAQHSWWKVTVKPLQVSFCSIATSAFSDCYWQFIKFHI